VAEKIADVEHIEDGQVFLKLLVNYGTIVSGEDKSYPGEIDERLVVPVQ
jgi:hypothetical protein